MIPVIPVLSWVALQKARSRGITVAVKQMAAQWIVVVDGEVAHADDAPMLVRDVLKRQQRAAA